MRVVTTRTTPAIEVVRVRPCRLALAAGAFGVVWGGSLFLAWRNWEQAAAWWAKQVPQPNAAIVEADRSRLLHEAIGVTGIVLGLVVLMVLVVRRRGPASATALAGALALAGAAAWAVAAAAAPKGLDGVQPSNCSSLLGVSEGSTWMPHGWSWSDFGEVVIVVPAHGPPRRVVCG
jgi:hypothetical protein